MNAQSQNCRFKRDGKEVCNLAEEMICNRKVCTLYVQKDKPERKKPVGVIK